MAVIPLPPVIINHLGKLTLGAAVTTLGGLAYAHRERISRWLDDAGLDITPRAGDEVHQTIESLKEHRGQMALSELDKKHAELLDKLTAMNTKTMGDLRGLINEAQSEVITSMSELEGQLDAQRSETRALGEELREAVADLTRRQDVVEQFLHGKDRGEVFAVPGRQRTAAETPRRQEEKGKKPSPNGSKRKGNGSTAPETRAP
nr:hypothetical protein [Vitiosangium cumulatum]